MPAETSGTPPSPPGALDRSHWFSQLRRLDDVTARQPRVYHVPNGQALALCPGYLRGLAFVGDYAVMGLFRPRHDQTFSGLQLEENLAAKGAEPRCGLQVIDLRTGDCTEWLRLENSKGSGVV